MTSIGFDEFIKNAQTGDLLLYSTSKWYSKVIELFSGSKFSHISIVLKDPVYLDPKLKGFYVLESGYESTTDPADGKHHFGVQITPLHNVIKDYQNSWLGTLYYRKLDCSRDSKFEDMIKQIYKKVYNKPYDIDILTFYLYFNPFKTPNYHFITFESITNCQKFSIVFCFGAMAAINE